jgi:DNA-binding transcriptional LysR family regulator
MLLIDGIDEGAMELRQLAAFDAVVRTGSVTRAAAELNYVQSSVTAQIQALEADLGVRLFDRIGRRLALTDAGRQLAPIAQRMLAMVDEAREAVTQVTAPRGTVTISSPESVCTYRLPALMERCRAEYPEIQLVFRPLPAQELVPSVRAGKVDIAFVPDERQQIASLQVEPLVVEPLAILVAPEHRLAGGPPVRPADFTDETLLLTESGCPYRGRFLALLSEAGVAPQTIFEFGSVETIKQCVLAGMGVALLPVMAVARELAEGRLVALPWQGAPLTMATQLVWHSARWPSPAMRAVIELARGIYAGVATVCDLRSLAANAASPSSP